MIGPSGDRPRLDGAGRLAPSAEAEYRKAQSALLSHYGSGVESRFVDIGQPPIRIHLLEGGKGSAVVLLHDAGMSAVGWVPLLAALERRFYTVAADLPGFGLSQALTWKGMDFRSYSVELVESLLDAVAVPTAHLVGNGVGGYCCLAFALARPERVGKLVLAGAPHGLTREAPRLLRLLGLRPFGRALFSTVLKPDWRQTRQMLGTMFVANVANVPLQYVDCVHLARTIPGTDAGWQHLLGELFTLTGFRTRYLIGDELGRIRAASLLLWGDSDWFAPLSAARKALALLPKGRLHVLSGVGHLPWLEDPPQTEERVMGFLET